jgi:hypothetical protein
MSKQDRGIVGHPSQEGREGDRGLPPRFLSHIVRDPSQHGEDPSQYEPSCVEVENADSVKVDGHCPRAAHGRDCCPGSGV